ncbi:hypothetical protein BLNAU_1174 [Blattamonas nauphoetae]|uniref:Uncharacterized protein n=1 Tax=Blattamonas nauphoetae TaxID=2049346 RepID=A0ABQ9YIM4_9EUKA|nr:hypothetical protein BLNAU_1174 [Blattamonas nauphoetae]
MTLEYVFHTLLVRSDHPDQPRCLSFGRDTPVLKTLLGTLSTDITQQTQKRDDTNRFGSYLVFLMMCTASTDDELSTEAIKSVSSLFQLPVSQTVALLHHTPPILSLPPDWPFFPDAQEEETRIRALSMGAYSGTLINTIDSDTHLQSRTAATIFTARMVNSLLGSLVSALRAATPPHRLPQTPLFSSLIQPTQEEREMWNNPAHPSTLSKLQSLVPHVLSAKISVLFDLSHLHKSWKADLSTTLAVALRLFQLVNLNTKEQMMTSLSCLTRQYWSSPSDIRVHLARIILEGIPVDPFDISPKLVASARFHVGELLNPPRTDDKQCFSDFTESLRRRMGEAEGDERWRVFVQLCIMSYDVMTETMEMVVLAETNPRSLLALSAATPQYLNWTPETLKVMEESARRLVCLAEQRDDVVLCGAAWRWMEKTLGSTFNPGWIILAKKVETDTELEKMLLGVLGRMVVRRREGVGDGEVVGEDRETTEVIVPCLHVLGVQLRRMTLDAAPFLPVLASLALTTDFGVLFPLLDVFAIISITTSVSPSPFTLSTITIPFIAPSDILPQPHSLLFVISSILLHTVIPHTHLDDLVEFSKFLSEQPPNPLTIPIVDEIVRQANALIVVFLAPPRHSPLLSSPMTSNSASQPTPTVIVSAVFNIVSWSYPYFSTLLNHFLPTDFYRFILLSLRQNDAEDDFFSFANQFLLIFTSSQNIDTVEKSTSQLHKLISLIFTRDEHSLHASLSSLSHLINYPNPFPTDLHPTFVAFREEGLENLIEKTDDCELWRMLKQFGANCPAEVCFTPHTVPRRLIYMEHVDEEELIHRLMDFEREEMEG